MNNQLPFKTQFPLLNRGISEGRIVLDEGTKLFDIDNIAAYLDSTIEDSNYTLDRPLIGTVGPLRLPYRSMWAEYRVRPQGFEIGALLHELAPGSPERLQFYANLNDQEDPHPDAYLIWMSLYDSSYIYNGSSSVFWIQESGEYIAWSTVTISTNSYVHKVLEEEGKAAHDHAVSVAGAPILMAIGLTNARNIKTVDRVTKSTTKRRHRKRIPVPGTEYKVIKLPGAPSNRVDGEVENSGDTRYHTVRGHFKTYTAEKPLYGKLTGTWWWAPSVRGNRKHGEIISTYEQHTK